MEELEARRPRPLILASIGGPVCVYTLLPIILLMLLLIVSVQWNSYRGNFLIEKQQWRTVPGRITHSDIIHKRSYRPDVRYVYSADGNSFSGSTISFGYQGFADENEALRIISKYQVGQNVLVYCLKQEPTFSALAPFSTEPGSLATAKGVLISIPVLLTALIFTIGFDIRSRRQARI